MTFRNTLASIDWVMLSSACLLVMVGLAMLISATYTQHLFSVLFVKQLAATIVGLALFFILTRVPYSIYQRYVVWLYVFGMLGLTTVLLFGTIIRGTVSRIVLYDIQVQPSEFVKVIMVVVFAWLLSRHKRVGVRQLLMTIGAAAIPVMLIFREPDLGTAALIVLVLMGILIFRGLSWRLIIALVLVGAVLFAFAWQWLLLDYQKNRIVTYLDPTSDPLRSGYSIAQSMIALGSGQIAGRGLGHGPQSQLKFLPERHTDFILSSIGEELGLVGVCLVLFLYSVLLWRVLSVIRNTTNVFGQLLCVGVFWTFLASLSVNAGMNMGLIPVTGVPLPLVSYGGSNLVSTFLMLSLVSSVRIYDRFTQRLTPDISGFI